MPNPNGPTLGKPSLTLSECHESTFLTYWDSYVPMTEIWENDIILFKLYDNLALRNITPILQRRTTKPGDVKGRVYMGHQRP